MNPNLPWPPGTRPLMLAPMQGLTNRALRSLLAEWVRPDVFFTEFIRVRPGSKKPLSTTDRLEVQGGSPATPLVVQLIGRDIRGLSETARTAREAGAVHLNINLGCPYGRMNLSSAGGALLKHPEGLRERLMAVREQAAASFSVKLRSGYDRPGQVFELLPLFEECGVDFLVIHPRTVIQKFSGSADHEITRQLTTSTTLPIIANGDITTGTAGRRVLEKTGAAGLMIGRGAIADPVIFNRIRRTAPDPPKKDQRAAELQHYLGSLLTRYQSIFQGERQTLDKLKAVLSQARDDLHFSREIRKMLRANSLARVTSILDQLQ